MKSLTLVLFLSIALCAQEKVSLSYNLPDNLEVAYSTHMEISLADVIELDVTLKSKSVAKQQNKEYLISNRLIQLSGKINNSGVEEEVDSDHPDFAQSTTGKSMAPYLQRDITALYNLQGERLSDAAAEEEPQDPLMRIVYPLEPMSVGDFWTSEEAVAQWGFPISFRYTLSKITADAVFVSISIPEDWDSDGMQMKEFAGSMEIDKTTGLVNQSALRFVAHVPRKDLEMSMKMTVKRL